MRRVVLAGAACGALATGGMVRAEPARLSGIVIAGEDRVAVFATRPGEPPLALREGDRLGEERVAAIATGAVRLEGPAGSRSIMLGTDAGTRTAAMAAVPRPAPFMDPYRRERESETDQ